MMPKASLFRAVFMVAITMTLGRETKQRSFITPPDYFDRIRVNQTNVADVKQLSTSIFQVTTNITGVGEVSYRLVDINGFLPFSEGSAFRVPVQNDAATLLLAIYHFNNIELSPIRSGFDISDCDIRFTATFFDTDFSPVLTTRRFTQVLQRHDSFAQPSPAAVVGAYRSAESAPLAIWTGVNGIPQVSYASTSTDFDAKDQFPLFGRTVTNTDGEASAAVELFQSFGSTHVAILFVTDTYGSSLQASFQGLSANYGIQTTSIAFSSRATDEEIATAVTSLQTTQIRHFYAICYEEHYIPIMTAAVNQSIVGSGFLWIFPGFDLINIYNTLRFPPGSPLVDATSGIGIITLAGGVTKEKIIPGVDFAPPLETNATSGFEKFRTSWRDAINDPYISSAFRSKIVNDIGRSSIPAFAVEPSFFSPFVYDAVMALGASMCQSGNNHTNFNGVQVFDDLKLLDFNGTSGRVKFDNITGTRDYLTMTFQLWNPLKFDKLEDNEVRFKMVPTNFFQDGIWQSLPNQPFIFASGTTTPPPSLPPVDMNDNFIGPQSRIVGYILMGIVMFCSFVCIIWLIIVRKERVVRASQPLFLIMIGVGTFVMASSILPLTFDESFTSKKSCLDSACMASPLLYLAGSIVAFSALYAKTRGVYQAYKNPDLNFIQVTSWDMAGGALIMLVVNCAIVIPWLVTAPLQWHRKLGTATDIFGRVVESYGFCSSVQALPFGIVVLVLNHGVLIFFTAKAFFSRHIETEYLESRYIGVCLASVLQAWLMGIPILVVVWSNSKARFFVETGIVFVTSQSVLLLIYIPKMLAVKKDRILELAQQKTQAYRKFSQRVKFPEEDDGEQNSGGFVLPVPRYIRKLRRKVCIKGLSVTEMVSEPGDESHLETAQEPLDSLPGEVVGLYVKTGEGPLASFEEMAASTRDVPSEEESKVEEAVEDVVGKLENRGWRPESPREHFIPQQRLMSQMGKSMMFSRGALKAREAAKHELGGVRVVFNPRSERNLRVTGGREFSRAQLFDFLHRKEDDDNDVPLEEEEEEEEVEEEEEEVDQ